MSFGDRHGIFVGLLSGGDRPATALLCPLVLIHKRAGFLASSQLPNLDFFMITHNLS